MKSSVELKKEYYSLQSIVVVVLLQVISYFDIIPIWCLIYAGLIVAFKLFNARTHTVVKFVFSILAITIFAFYYKTQFSVEMAASFLFLASVLKILELKFESDIVTYVYVMLYLAASSFLFEQGIVHTVLQLLILLFCFSILLRLHVGGESRFDLSQLKTVFKLSMLVIPLVGICFMFFPRIAPLWSIPVKNNDAMTGISNRMAPGDFEALVQSNEVAFRVEFEGALPPREQLYWRGLVLDYFDGRAWTQNLQNKTFDFPRPIDSGRLYEVEPPSYRIMLEPHNNEWVFALEGSSVASSNIRAVDMGLFNLNTDAIQATRFQMEFDQEIKVIPSVPTSRIIRNKDRKKTSINIDTQVPRSTNPRTREFALEIKQKYSSDAERLIYLLNYFREQTYFYTLRPPATGDDFVDGFMFETQQGFCSHFAGSLAYIMRIMGIPARVVVGYQGGTFNEDGNYLIVHQYDAHAWVEVRLDDIGWIRVDPTAMVAPQRVLSSFEDVMTEEGDFLSQNPVAAAMYRFGPLSWLRLRLDELDFYWQKQVVNYNLDDQRSIVRDLFGEFSLAKLGSLFIGAFIIVAIVLMVYVSSRLVVIKYSRAEKKYRRWLRLLRLFGYERNHEETPSDFLKRIEKDERSLISSITRKRTESLIESEYR